MAILQRPYRRTFGFLPISAWVWHPDTLTSWHRMRQRLGTAPAIFDEETTDRTDRALQRVMQQQGYLDAVASHRVRIRNGKALVTYDIKSGRPRRLASLAYVSADTTLQRLIDESPSARLLQTGQLLDRSRLESERERITAMLRERGYWDFNKEDVSFLADTLAGSEDVDLTCVLQDGHKPWRIRQVHFFTDMFSSGGDSSSVKLSTRALEQPGYDVTWSGEHCYLRDRVLIRNSHVLPGMLYSERAVRNTYASLSRLHILRYVNVRVEPVPGESQELDCNIYLSPLSNHAVQFEIDGTNTAGDLGFALGATYQHRNIFHGSEAFTTHLKGSYEALSGNVEKLVNDNYQEYAAEFSVDFPQFLFPFIKDETRRKSLATTLVKASLSRQSRPEYNRNVASAVIGYKWSTANSSIRHVWDVLNISYVYLPEQSETFKSLVQNLGPIIYSSYTDHFIFGMDYTIYMGNNILTTGRTQQTTRDLWYLRLNPEISGNLLSAVCNSVRAGQTSEGRYEIFGQPFEQYARFDADWSYSHYMTDRSRLALHLAGGVAVPYGNSDVMPFEKRYYSGGANSVRGWSVRELGPGKYASAGSAYNYFNQCGDVRLDASVELRTRLFWKFESAFFVDAGNVWTIKEYENQEGGRFTSNFYKEIAASWGLGLRVVTDFVILRLDWGFKAFDPSSDADESWALPHPFRSSHNTLHFAVGYPF
jgi:outer membrane protein assembly factor BamA